MARSHMLTALGSLVGAALVSLATVPAVADMGHPAVHRARQALSRYDIEGDGSTQVIASLGRAIAEMEQPPDRREARFLRAMAAADLVLIAHATGRGSLTARVAEAFGVGEDELTARVASELGKLSVGVYAAAADDAAGALRAMKALGAGEEVDWTRRSGPRSDLLYVAAVRRALEDDAEDGTPELATLAADPCAEDGEDGCSDPLRRFAGADRRAIAAVVRARQARARLGEAARAGDPFPRALEARLAQDERALGEAVLTPAPPLPDDLGLTGAPQDAATPAVDLVLVVREGEVHYGWTPRVRVAEDGEVQVGAAGRPILPETAKLPIPRDFRPAVTAIDALTPKLQQLVEDGRPRLGLGAPPDLPAHVACRVLHSAEDAGLVPVVLLGRATDGTARGVPVQVRDVRKGPEGKPAVRVFVRLGGYTVRTSAGKRDVPRVRDESGSLRFDLQGLDEAAGSRPPPTASLDFMAVAAMGPVLQAAYRVAPAREALQLLIP
ncbi:MAG: hypothetical protein ACOC97_00105 [Myxococcota bacterium]